MAAQSGQALWPLSRRIPLNPGRSNENIFLKNFSLIIITNRFTVALIFLVFLTKVKIKYLDGDITKGKNTNQESSHSLMEQFGDFLSKINTSLERELDLYSWSEFYSPLKYASDGGKRIRPLILILSSEIIKSKNNDNTNTNLTNSRQGGYSKRDDERFLAASAIGPLHTQNQ